VLGPSKLIDQVVLTEQNVYCQLQARVGPDRFSVDLQYLLSAHDMYAWAQSSPYSSLYRARHSDRDLYPNLPLNDAQDGHLSLLQLVSGLPTPLDFVPTHDLAFD
jgi:hypothetical protein